MGAAVERRPVGAAEVIVRFAGMLCGIVFVAALGACTDDKPAGPAPSAAGPSAVPAASAPAWQEPANYTYAVDRRCAGGPSLGAYRVTVQGSAVASSVRTDGKTASGEEEIELPTLGGLLELARTAAEDGGEMSTSADPADGHPVEIAFDVSEGAGERACFVITEYAVQG
jgi:hypothetical protein